MANPVRVFPVHEIPRRMKQEISDGRNLTMTEKEKGTKSHKIFVPFGIIGAPNLKNL